MIRILIFNFRIEVPEGRHVYRKLQRSIIKPHRGGMFIFKSENLECRSDGALVKNGLYLL